MVVQGRLSVRDEKAPPDSVRLRVSPGSDAGAAPPPKQDGGKLLEGQVLYLKFPQPGPPVGAAHEAGLCHVSGHHAGEDGDGGHPEGPRHPRAAPPGTGGGGQGDPGAGKMWW